MTDHDLTTLLRDHVAATEPISTLDAERSMTLGRRTLVRRRARRGLAAAALLGAAAVAVPALLSHDVLPRGDRAGIDKATAAALEHYDAAAMPQILADASDPIISRAAPGIADSGAFLASDDQGVELPTKYWDKASEMDLSYGGSTDHRFRLSLLHSASEAEGNARNNCENDVANGYAFTCDVTTVHGDTVTTRVVAVRKMERTSQNGPMWSVVTRDELRTGKAVAGDPSRLPIDRNEIYFLRSTESVHSESFLTMAEETVKARSLASARQAFTVPVADQVDLVTNPALVIPKPPTGKNGCPWMLHPASTTCGVKAP
jgi:hypothetical protein